VFHNLLRLIKHSKPDNPLKNARDLFGPRHDDLSVLNYNECKNNRYVEIKFLPENGDAWAFLDCYVCNLESQFYDVMDEDFWITTRNSYII